MRRLIISLFLIALVAPAAAWAAGSDSPAPSGNADFATGKNLISQERYAEAIPPLSKAVAAAPRNADYLTLLAFAYRKTGQFEPAYTYYDKALAIDPKHKGALNYLGILYVQTGQTEKANEMLARLDDACWFSCAEYDSLKQAIESGGDVGYSRY